MNKLIVMAAIAVIFFSSCATQRNFEKYAAKHPVKLAELCIEKFPIRDSIGEPVIDSSHKADNLDHSGTIDSLKDAADALVKELEAKTEMSELDKGRALDVIGEYTLENVNLKKKVKGLASDISRLQANYRPCLPDTVFRTIPHFLENPAKDVVINSLRNQLAKTEQQRDDAQHKAKVRWWIIFALGCIIGAAIFGRVKGII